MKVLKKIIDFFKMFLDFLYDVVDYFIGIRVFKTALAVVICVYVSSIFTTTKYLAATAAVVTLQASMSETLEAGSNRLLSTFIALLVAFFFQFIGFLGYLAIFLGSIIIIRICVFFKLDKAVTIATIVFILVMVFDGGGTSTYKNVYIYGLYRFLETSLGITVAMFVNQFVFPVRK